MLHCLWVLFFKKKKKIAYVTVAFDGFVCKKKKKLFSLSFNNDKNQLNMPGSHQIYMLINSQKNQLFFSFFLQRQKRNRIISFVRWYIPISVSFIHFCFNAARGLLLFALPFWQWTMAQICVMCVVVVFCLNTRVREFLLIFNMFYFLSS